MKTLADRLKKLEKLRENPGETFPALWRYYSDHPVEFINDWGITYDPRLKNPIVPFIMYPKQEEYILWLYDKWLNRKDGLCEKSRDAGATWLSAAFSVWLWLFHEGQKIGWGSRKESLVDKLGDPDAIFEKMRLFISYLPKEFLPPSFRMKDHGIHLRIINPDNGSTIIGEAGDQIGRGGRSSMYFKDESAFYERPERIEAALSQNSDVKIDISTPNGNGNPFYRKRFGGEIDVFTFHWKDDPRKDQEWYENQRRLLDPVVLAQEVDINYDASVDNALIAGDIVDKAMRMRPTDIQQGPAPVIMGIDVARFGNDRTVFALREGRIVTTIKMFSKLDTMETVAEAMKILGAVAVSVVFVDETGIGSGVVDRLRELGINVIGVNFGAKANNPKYVNKRAEMWGEMNDWLSSESVSLPNHPAMKTDLCGLKYKYNSNSQFVLESKEEAKKRGVKSPDIGDAIALTFAEPINPDYNAWAETHDRYRETDDTGY